MVDELKYEINGVRSGNGVKKVGCPKQSRMEKEQLFANQIIYYNQPFVKFTGPLDELKVLVPLAGGILVNSLKEMEMKMKEVKNMKFIIINDSDDYSLTKCSQAKHLPINEFIDSITNLEKL